MGLSNLLSARSLLSQGSIKDAARDGPCAHGKGWVRVMVEFGTSSALKGRVVIRVLGYGSGVSGRKVKSRDCALVG